VLALIPLPFLPIEKLPSKVVLIFVISGVYFEGSISKPMLRFLFFFRPFRPPQR